MTYLKSMSLLVITVLLLSVSPTLAEEGHEHHGDIIVGRTLAGQLAIEADLDEAIVLPPTPTNPFTPGWTGDEPGFDHLHDDEPGENFYSLELGADIYLDLISIDPGLQISDLAISQILDDPADPLLLLGDEELHIHVLFNISSTVLPAYDGSPLFATLQLVDLGTTGYATSAPFTMEFVPEPTSLVLLGLGGLALRRRFRNVG